MRNKTKQKTGGFRCLKIIRKLKKCNDELAFLNENGITKENVIEHLAKQKRAEADSKAKKLKATERLRAAPEQGADALLRDLGVNLSPHPSEYKQGDLTSLTSVASDRGGRRRTRKKRTRRKKRRRKTRRKPKKKTRRKRRYKKRIK